VRNCGGRFIVDTTRDRREDAIHHDAGDGMSTGLPLEDTLHHHGRVMGGRDPHERHRVATPLELLFDLTFASCFGLAAAQFAHLLAEAHYVAALIGFGFSSFAICWAWINFSWFSSAYDTDDWLFRVVTMVQMIGVLILAIGLPRMFASVAHGEHFDNTVMVLGYVVMRIAMVFQWLRAARQDPARRRACLTYAIAISIAQIGWIAQILVDASIATTLLFAAVLAAVEFAGPWLAERKDGGTPWHAHHIAERYALFAIIAFGEGVIGTATAVSAAVDAQGWNMDAVLVCIAGVGLTFGMWWMYYMLPSAAILHAHRERSFAWGYGQIVIIASIVATGAGLHVAAYSIEHQSRAGALATLLCTATPVAVFLGAIYALHAQLVRWFDAFHGWLLAANVAVVAGAIIAVGNGSDMSIGLVILMLAPVVTVIGYEVLGYRHQAAVIEKPGQVRNP
jgi:low temperature requirement protein LtrA